jgi:uncharacterized membrane protein
MVFIWLHVGCRVGVCQNVNYCSLTISVIGSSRVRSSIVREIFVLIQHLRLDPTQGQQISQPYMASGVVAAICFTLLCIVFVRPVRNKSYEFFYITHSILVLYDNRYNVLSPVG